jgi:hypothetical protein
MTDPQLVALVDLIKSLLWPSVAVWALWYWRDELKAAAKRVTEIGLTGAKFAPPEQHATTPSSATAAATGGDVEKTLGAAGKPDLQIYIGKLKSNVSEDQLEPAAQKMRGDLTSIVGPNLSDQVEALLYTAASLNIQLSHERNYNAIFGSQLSLLAQANAAGGVVPEMVKALYDEAKAKFPELYAKYSIDQWIGFLTRSGLLTQEASGAYSLTNYGRGFLKYIVDRHLTINKPN